jgi:hypothetical protein
MTWLRRIIFALANEIAIGVVLVLYFRYYYKAKEVTQGISGSGGPFDVLYGGVETVIPLVIAFWQLIIVFVLFVGPVREEGTKEVRRV